MQIKKYRSKHLLLLLLSAVFTLTTSLSAIAKSSIKLPQWHNIQLPKQASLRGSAIMGNSLWVSGTNNTVFVSQDGGKTWQDKSPQLPLAITLNTDYRDIA
ncbi:MAG: hypothetical protein JKX78_02240, partial [Alteromonadaceae bacterium]|nr:hypothetical protein [Alteromonadaceae bacterium]